MYYTYVVRCEDDTLYTGITTDLDRRMNEHMSQGEKCAKYTKRHKVLGLECAWKSDNRILASKLEYHFKRLKKEKKEKIIKNNKLIGDYLSQKIDVQEYIFVELL